MEAVEAPAANGEEDEDIELQLEKFKESLKPEARRFTWLHTGIPGSIFISTKLEDPMQLAHAIMTAPDLEPPQAMIRLIPIAVSCKAFQENIVRAVGELVAKFPSEPALRFRVHIKSRYNSSFSKDSVMEGILEVVRSHHPNWVPTYQNYTHSLLVEVLKTTCCLSFLGDYEELCKYNLVELGKVAKTPAPPDHTT
ncbi:THUMPD1 [Cordylochernes scorpioides]|uniref:THUMPD1 n=1 Tax=Cordylochernes scorpioides TaxID=51811 RepID=A0ABY6LI84_9ARAC|nr:THUMPD1 [Cordylochernes scorpioides]